jgi:hypothetical protein
MPFDFLDNFRHVMNNEKSACMRVKSKFDMKTPNLPLCWMSLLCTTALCSQTLAIDSDLVGLDDAVEAITGIYVSASNASTTPPSPSTDRPFRVFTTVSKKANS